MTSAAFAKGLLGLGGDLPPILVSLVRKDESVNTLLDDCTTEAKEIMNNVKERLHLVMQRDCDRSTVAAELNPSSYVSIARCIDAIGNPQAALVKLQESMLTLYEQLSAASGVAEPVLADMRARWSKLIKDFYKAKKKSFDISKVPDIYDSIKHDLKYAQVAGGAVLSSSLWELFQVAKLLVRNPKLRCSRIRIVIGRTRKAQLVALNGSLYSENTPRAHHGPWSTVACRQADVIIPLEYGITCDEKIQIAKLITAPLRKKLVHDLQVREGQPRQP